MLNVASICLGEYTMMNVVHFYLTRKSQLWTTGDTKKLKKIDKRQHVLDDNQNPAKPKILLKFKRNIGCVCCFALFVVIFLRALL